MSPSKASLKNEVKSVARSNSDFNYDSNHGFFKFLKGYDDFDAISLDSKGNKMKEFNKLLISFKSVATKKPRNKTEKGANYEKC